MSTPRSCAVHAAATARSTQCRAVQGSAGQPGPVATCCAPPTCSKGDRPLSKHPAQLLALGLHHLAHEDALFCKGRRVIGPGQRRGKEGKAAAGRTGRRPRDSAAAAMFSSRQQGSGWEAGWAGRASSAIEPHRRGIEVQAAAAGSSRSSRSGSSRPHLQSAGRWATQRCQSKSRPWPPQCRPLSAAGQRTGAAASWCTRSQGGRRPCRAGGSGTGRSCVGAGYVRGSSCSLFPRSVSTRGGGRLTG
jgi:hypothetical protein